MLVLKKSLFSEKKEKIKLKDIPHGIHGLSLKSAYSPSIGELTGRKVGMEVADKMDEEGKDPFEVLDKSRKEAKKAGRIPGAVVGGGVGLITGLEAKKYLKKAANIVEREPEILEAFKERVSIKKGKRLLEKLKKNPEKTAKKLRRASIPTAVVLTGLGAYRGKAIGSKRAEKAVTIGNLNRLAEKHEKNEE